MQKLFVAGSDPAAARCNIHNIKPPRNVASCCRALFSEVNKRFPTMPFTLRAVEAEQKRFGLVECINHGLLHPYPVLHEKSGELVSSCTLGSFHIFVTTHMEWVAWPFVAAQLLAVYHQARLGSLCFQYSGFSFNAGATGTNLQNLGLRVDSAWLHLGARASRDW